MILLHAGADFDLANAQGYTPIHLAAREGLLGLWFHEFLLLVFFIILMNYKFWFHVFFCFVFRSCSKPLCLWMCCWHIDLWWKLSPSFSGQKWLVILLVSRVFFYIFLDLLMKNFHRMEYFDFTSFFLGHTEVVRCLCLAGCKIEVKNKDGVTPELAALSQGHGEISDLLKRLKRVRYNYYDFITILFFIRIQLY